MCIFITGDTSWPSLWESWNIMPAVLCTCPPLKHYGFSQSRFPHCSVWAWHLVTSWSWLKHPSRGRCWTKDWLVWDQRSFQICCFLFCCMRSCPHIRIYTNGFLCAVWPFISTHTDILVNENSFSREDFQKILMYRMPFVCGWVIFCKRLQTFVCAALRPKATADEWQTKPREWYIFSMAF